MVITIYIFVFLFGLIIGSFLNALDYSLKVGKTINRKHSECPNCKHFLSPLDLVPLFSFLFLKGRCRYCGKNISWQYPVVEFITASTYVLLFWHFFYSQGSFLSTASAGFFGALVSFLFWLVFTAIFMLIVVSDLREMVIPDGLVYTGIFLAFFYMLIISYISSGNVFVFWPLAFNLLAGLVGSGFFLALILASKGEWMGGGDVKLAVMIGWAVGWPNIFLSLGSAFLLGSFFGLSLIVLGKRKMADAIPFGPFLILGAYIGLVFGNMVFRYLGFTYSLF